MSGGGGSGGAIDPAGGGGGGGGGGIFTTPLPVPMLLWCPECGERHVDAGRFAVLPHHTHACQHCGHVWRPALVATVGVQFLPGFKNA